MVLGELHRCSPIALASILWLDYDIPHPPRAGVVRVITANPEVPDDLARVVNEVGHSVTRGGSTRGESMLERLIGVFFSGARRLTCSDQVRLVLDLAPFQP
jgi:hypothetical protein